MSKQRPPARRRAAAPSAARSKPARLPKTTGPRPPGLQSAAGFSPRPAVQRQLKVGAKGDAYEREADQVADRVMSGQPAPTISHLPAAGLPATAQRATGMEEEETAETAQAKTEEAEEQTAQTQTAEEEETAQTQAEELPEEETAQTEEMPEEETAQTEEMPEEEETAQTQPVEDEEPMAQAKPRRPQGRERPHRSEAERALRSPGAGSPLPGEVRQRIEGSTGADLADVRVHEGTPAERAARSLDARAFAHGRDIWLGQGESARDARLMAHEAAHVVQQTGRGQSATTAAPGPAPAGAVQRATAAASPGGHSEIGASVLDMPSKTMEIPEISLPDVANKRAFTGEMVAQKPGARETSQKLTWLREMQLDSTGVTAATPDSRVVPVRGASGGGEAAQVEGGRTVTGVWFLRLGRSKEFVVGTRETLAQSARLPNWKAAGTKEYLQVDHVHEDQLGGPDTLENFQLLDGKTNRNAGNAIRNEIKTRIKNDVKKHLDIHPAVAGEPDPFEELRAIRDKPDDIRRAFNRIVFKNKSVETLPVAGPAHRWTVDQIRKAEHLKVLTPTNDPSILPPLGSDRELVIFGGEGGAAPVKIPLRNGEPQFNGPRKWFAGVQGLTVNSVDYTGTSLSLNTTFFKYGQLVRNVDEPLALASLGGNPFTFQMPTDLTQTAIGRALELKRASGITVESAAIVGDAVTVKGQVTFSSPLFKDGTTADVVVEGEDVRLSKTFQGGEFDLPGPIDIIDSSLTISVGTSGGAPNLMLEGAVNFAVERVGKGALRGQGGLATGVAVEGEFEFDPALFKGADAKINVRYVEDRFSGEGTLKIGDGQIKGIRSAALAVKLADDVWTADGTVEPKIPGFSEGSLSMVFDPNGGFEITGRLTLGAGIPRLKSGHLEATLKKEGEAYIVSGKGSAELDIPGVAAALTAEYRDGLFKVEATVGYERGLAKGWVTVGATNMPVDENGTPAGEPGEQVSVYGQGSVTIRFTPWLEGTAGIKVAPDGQIEVRGRIALPASVEVFPEKKIEKELLSIGVDLPIVGVAVAGQRIGIFLNIGGSLTARASIGPGTLEDVAVEVVYNPEDEASAKVTGTARFVVPAEAGLRLAIRGSLGAGIPIVSAEAGLEIGGELGVAGEASAGATVEWSPSTGISMEADVKVLAHPKFTFDVTGFVEVTADLWITEIDLYSKRWKLTSVEFGSGMEVGAKLKIMVENNEVKPISFDDIEFIVPPIDPVETAKSLIQSL